MDDEQQGDAGPSRSEHAEQRASEGRRTGPAFNDAQRSRKSDVFMDEETDRYILRAVRGREHVFEMDGELVTSIDRSHNAHLRRLKNGRIRAVTDDEFAKFQELFSNE